MATSLITTDKRGRFTLGPKEKTYKVIELEHGALLLEPAQVLTDVEVAALRTPGFIAQIDSSMARPTQGRARERRSPRD